MSLFVALPCVLVMSVNVGLHMKHEFECPPERPEFIPYEHLRIRNKVIAQLNLNFDDKVTDTNLKYVHPFKGEKDIMICIFVSSTAIPMGRWSEVSVPQPPRQCPS